METFQSFKKRSLKNPAVRREYEKLEPEFALISAIIAHRIKTGMTQAALAHKIGTKQSAIARLESGTYNPSLTFLHKVAKALDTRLEISLQ